MRLDEQTRRDFPILSRTVNGHPLVYLDSAASSQKPRAVLEAMDQYYTTSHANVHRSIHTLGEEATEQYEAARDRVQRFIGAASREEVVFTRGTTDGINLVAEALGRALRPGDEILITDMEHHSNIIPWQMAARDRRVRVRSIPLTGDGLLDARGLRPDVERAYEGGGLHPCVERPGHDHAGGPALPAGARGRGSDGRRWRSGCAAPSAQYVRAGL